MGATIAAIKEVIKGIVDDLIGVILTLKAIEVPNPIAPILTWRILHLEEHPNSLVNKETLEEEIQIINGDLKVLNLNLSQSLPSLLLWSS